MSAAKDTENESGGSGPQCKETSWNQTEKDTAEPPDGGLSAWLQLLGSFCLILNTWGILNTFGAYQTYYESTLLGDKSSSSISWIGTVQAFLMEIVGVITGPIFDRGHLYILLSAGCFLVVFGMMMLSLCTEYWQVFLTQGICVGIGSGILFVPSVAVVTSAFNAQRALAVGLAASASSVGGVIYPIVFRQLQPKIGFAWATRVIAFIILGTFCVSFTALGSRNNNPAGKKPRTLVDTHAFKDLPFMIYILALFVLYAGYFVPYFYIPSFASVSLHTSEDLAFYLLAVNNAAAFVGRLLPALIPKRRRAIEMFVSATLCGGIMTLGWIGIHNVPGFIIFCVLYGLLSGVVITLTTVMILDLSSVSPEMVGTRLGMAYVSLGFGILIGNPIAGALSDTTRGDFTGVQAWSGATLLLGSALLIYPWMVIRRRRV